MLKRTALVASLVALSTGAFQLSHAKAPQTGKEDAGGRAIAHHAGGRVITSPPVQERAPDARLYHLGTVSREPTIGTTLNGDVFYAALGFDDIKSDEPNASTKVMRSTDNGGTWEDSSPSIAEVTHRHPVTLDPYVYVDDSEGVDRIFTIDLTVACSYLSFTDDYGETWTTNPLACGRPVNDHQTLFGGPPVSSPTIGYPNVMYYCWNDVGSSSCSKSLDGGIAFSVTGQPAFFGYEAANGDPDGRRFCGGLHGHGVVDDRGFVYLPRMCTATLRNSRSAGTKDEPGHASPSQKAV